ncbi:SDR family NAD(P)-dependent oxidoreductase [Mailhella massiliensis]|uniref:SDR family oxidoreductase n=1 Tax=Mailhella massiliensis TaxID=1903261 RepID=A0A921AUX4_9BACT|nr:SDR family NAD(P)-dependent oxidoreductase [Mailhella massiliensis]HJD96564.1 SDR family oxidoreductase [Mailhella massiliensis]
MTDYKTMADLTGKTALVTGGAEGIGHGIAGGLASAGAHVLIASRNGEKCRKASEEFKSQGLNVDWYTVDTTDEASMDRLFAHVKELFGRLDIMVNNSGISFFSSMIDMPIKEFDKLVSVNIRGTFLGCQYAARMMKEQGGGKILNLSSPTVIKCYRNGSAPYSVTKAAISQMTRMFAGELAEDHIHVNAIGPGVIITNLNRARYDAHPELLDMVTQAIPMHHVNTPEEMAALSVFLCSSASDYITGQIIYIDGGACLI